MPRTLQDLARTSALVASLVVAAGCQHTEPRWIIDRLPGEYPDVVYYVPTDSKLIALTIDDGPDPVATPAILAALAEHDAKATFFLVSSRMEQYPDLVADIVCQGHELGHHMTVDRVSAKLSPAEFDSKLLEAEQVINRYQFTNWFRPGSAWYTDTMKEAVTERGYRIALASMIPFDARLAWPGFISWYINATVNAGSVMVLHSNGERGLRSVQVLNNVLPRLNERGYQVRSLSAVDGAAKPLLSATGAVRL